MNMTTTIRSCAKSPRRALLLALACALLCLGALMGASAAAPAAADTTTGDISLLAWRDDNSNKAIDEGEPRVAGVVIKAKKADSGLLSQCVTDSAGACLLSGLAPGSYYISIQPPAEMVVTFPGPGTLAEAVLAGQTTYVRLGLESTSGTPSSPTPSATPTQTATMTRTPTASILRRDVTFQYKMDGYPFCNPVGIPGCYRVPEDTYLDAWQPDTNLSESDILRFRATGPEQISAPLFKFDLFRIPVESAVISATLSLYVQTVTASEDTDVALYRLLRPWTAAQANWRNARTSEAWQSPGANGIAVDRAAAPESTATLRGAGQWVHFDVTAAVRSWVANPAGNHGLILRSIDPTSSGYRYEFISSEPVPGQGKDALRPKLRVVYEAPPTPLEARFGVGFSSGFREYPDVRRSLTDYDWEIMRIGWYSDWSYTPSWTILQPYLPQGMEYVHLIDVSNQRWPPSWARIQLALTRTPGMIWIVGNEPEDPSVLTPAQYAERYYAIYTFIKQHDPTAQVAIGGVVQPTPLRRIWLERMFAEYQTRYGTAVPVDMWNIHMQILTEQRATDWPIPVGLDWDTVRRYGINYHPHDNAGIVAFVDLITDFRRWLKEKGYQDKPLMISEYGVLYPGSMLNAWGNTAYGQKVLKEYMTLTFDYLLQAQDRDTGYPADDYRLVQRWLWYSLNINPPDMVKMSGYNGALFDWMDPDYPGTLTEAGYRYLQYMQVLNRPPQESLTVTTNTGTDVTTVPTVDLTIWAADMSQVDQIALSAGPGAFHIRQTKNSTNEPLPSLTAPPLLLTQTRFVTPPAGNEITITWDLTDTRYGGSAAEGSKTIYARLRYKNGTWSRMYLTTVRYAQHIPTVTPTPPNSPTPTAILSPTVTPTGYVAPTQTRTPTPTATWTPTITPTPTPTVGYLCVRVFHDRNGDLSYQPGTEELLAGAQLEVLDTQFQVLHRYTTDGSSEPFCIGGLAAGNYYVRETDPPGYASEVRYFSVAVVANRSAVLSIGDHLASSGR